MYLEGFFFLIWHSGIASVTLMNKSQLEGLYRIAAT